MVVVLALLAGCATAPSAPDPADGVDAVLEHARTLAGDAAAQMRRGGVGIVVVSEGVTVLTEGYGFADQETGREIDPDTVFRMGSITKLFTVFAVMQLVEDGLVDLDAPLSRYIPEFVIQTREPYRAITVRDVMSHHAGLPADLYKGWASGVADAEGWDTAYRDYLILLPQEYATMPPRTFFSYSNIGFSLLGLLVEQVSGQQYSEYVESSILQPLGMGSSGFYVEPEFAQRIATGYPNKGMEADDLAQIRDVPAGSLYASLEDMGRFMEMVVQEGRIPGSTMSIVDADTFELMGQRQNQDVELDFDFSIGLTFWLINPTSVPDVHLMSHGGDIPPYHALLVTAPDEGIAVLVTTNADAGAAAVLNLGVEVITSLLEATRGRGYDSDLLTDLPEEPLSEQTVASLTGSWVSPLGPIQVSGRRGQLKLRTAMGPITGVHRGNGYLSAQVNLLGIPLVQLHPLYIRHHQLDDQDYIGMYQMGIPAGYATRYEAEVLSEEWLGRIGDYEILNPDEFRFVSDPALVIDKTTGGLAMRATSALGGGETTIPLSVVSDTLAVTAGMGRTLGEAVQIRVVNGEQLLHYSGLDMRRVE
jgi:CubicO group peptidase (beta-lactamase class C family)